MSILTDDLKQLIQDLQVEILADNGIYKQELAALEQSFKDYGLTEQEKAQFRTQMSVAMIQTVVPSIFNAAFEFATLDSKIKLADQQVLSEKKRTEYIDRQIKAYDQDIIRIGVEQWAKITAMAISVEAETAQDTINKYESILQKYIDLSCAERCPTLPPEDNTTDNPDTGGV